MEVLKTMIVNAYDSHVKCNDKDDNDGVTIASVMM